MTILQRAFFVFAILGGPTLASANPGPAPAPSTVPPGAEMSASEVSRWLAFFDKLVAVVIKAKALPCEKLAAEVSLLIDANRDAIAIGRNAHSHGKTLPAYAHRRMMAGVRRMVPAMERCRTHEQVRAVFTRLDRSIKG